MGIQLGVYVYVKLLNNSYSSDIHTQHTRTHAHTHMHARTHARTHARARTHAHTHTHTHTPVATLTTAMSVGDPSPEQSNT